ncbi:MAG: hypothetical protein RJA57_724 [Bacteroidota bacterium]|jgi:tRNA threonylcarbamoyladenosine biosynthesis protein TsaE
MEWILSANNMSAVAAGLWTYAGDRPVIAFHGEMGAGKTTLIRALCARLGIRDVVASPTFSLVNEYHCHVGGADRPVYHIDLYRLRDEAEAVQAGIEDLLHGDECCLVEWPERAPGIFPERTVHVFIEPLDTHTRRVKIGEK